MSKNKKSNKDIPVFRPFTPVIDNYVKGQGGEMTPVVDVIEDDAEPTLQVDPFDMPVSENSGVGAVYEHDVVYESIQRVAARAGSQKVKTVVETARETAPTAGTCHMCGHVACDARVGDKVNCLNCGHEITLI